MPEITRIECDHCGRDLGKMPGCGHGYRLMLSARIVAGDFMREGGPGRLVRPGVPPFIGESFFCSGVCLAAWAQAQPASLMREPFAPNDTPQGGVEG